MGDSQWGLSEKGFNRPTYTDLLNALEYRARELYGNGINLTVRSPLGVFLRILAWVWNILFSGLEDVYNSGFVETAAGNSLYNLGKNIGLQVLPEGKAAGYITITGAPGTVIPAGFLVGTNGGLQYTVMSPAVITESGEALAIIRAVQTGPEYNTKAGTIQVIVNPSVIPGVESVINKADVTGGRLKETDAEFRQRYYKSVDYAGGVNADAIRAAILNDVEGVSSALVYENDTDSYDPVYSLPPHSLEAVVYGGLDQEIARAIYGRRSAGIQTVGGVTVNVMTVSGQERAISFSRPRTVKVWVRVTGMVRGTDYGGDDAVKNALMDYIGNKVSGGLGIGADVIYIRLPGIITAAVPGTEDFDILISPDGEEYSRENIAVGSREKAITEESAVIIE